MDWEIGPENNLILVPDFRRAKYEGLRRHLGKVNWEPLGLAESQNPGLEPNAQEGQVETTYNTLVEVIAKGQRQHIPYQARRTETNNPKWMTRRLRHEIGLKRGIYRK